jgi:hypothetical protein
MKKFYNKLEKTAYILSPNDYVITPQVLNGKFVSLQDLIINTIADKIENSDKRSNQRELIILSCYSDRAVDFYKSFFKSLFKTLSHTPLTSVKIVFDTFAVTRKDYIRLQSHFKTDLYKGCKFEIRSSSESGLLHAKSVALIFGGSINKPILFCTSANFTRNAFSDRNKEFIYLTDSQKASNNFRKSFKNIWEKESSLVKCHGENVKFESVNSYLLKGKFLRDAESTEIPFNNSFALEFERENENSIFKEIKYTLQVKEEAHKKTVHFDRLILNCILNGQSYSDINDLRTRSPVLPLFSKCYDSYWITADTYNRLEKNIDFIEERDSFKTVVKLFGDILQYKDYILSLMSENVMTETVFSVLGKRQINGTEISREEFMQEIYNHVVKVFQKDNSLNWSQYYGFDVLNCYFADSQGEVTEQIKSALYDGYQKPVKESFKELILSKQMLNRSDCEEFNEKLFEEMTKKLENRRLKGNESLKEMIKLLQLKYDILSNKRSY